MFDKRELIFAKRDRDAWQKIRRVLKEAGDFGVRAGHYQQESVVSCGCGAHLDPRDFGPRGKIDREIYWVKVIRGREEDARTLLRSHGIEPEIDETVKLDAPHRKNLENT